MYSIVCILVPILCIVTILVFFPFKKIKFKQQTEGKKSNYQYLLFSSVGSRDVLGCKHWVDSDRNYDIVIYAYGNVPQICKEKTDKLIYRKDYKFPNFYHYATNNDISKYDAIWIVDDDIVMETKDINKMFDKFMKHKLLLAQPAYDKTSDISWPLLSKRKKGGIVYTNFIEVSAPVYSREAIQKSLDTFKDSKHAWGLDYIVSTRLMKNTNDKNYAL